MNGNQRAAGAPSAKPLHERGDRRSFALEASSFYARARLGQELFAVSEIFIAFVLEPLFFARSAGVSSIALLIAAAFWTWLWGPIGLALAIPLTVCLVVFSRTIEGLEFIEILVADDPGLAPHVLYYQRVLAADEQDAASLVREAATADSSEAAYDAILVPALAAAGAPAPMPRAVVAGCPLQDEADRVVLEMLGRLLESSGRTFQTRPAGVLGIETVATRPQLLLSSMDGGGRVRDLVKRLRGACPDVPIPMGPRRDLEPAVR